MKSKARARIGSYEGEDITRLLELVSAATVALLNLRVFSNVTVPLAKSAVSGVSRVTVFLVKLITPEVSVTAAVTFADKVTVVPLIAVTTVPEAMPVPETTAPTRMCALVASMVSELVPFVATPRELSASVTPVFTSAAVVAFDNVIVELPLVAVT